MSSNILLKEIWPKALLSVDCLGPYWIVFPSTNKPAALVAFLFFSPQQYSSFWFRNYSLPKLVGKSASRLHARAAPPIYFRLVFIFVPVRIFECIMLRILSLFQTLSHFIFASFVLLERIGEILIHPANMSRFPSLVETQNTTPESHKSLREKCSRPESYSPKAGPSRDNYFIWTK